MAAGNVHTESPAALYRSSELFRNIRETGRYAGKCGRCEFRNLCGGSRARSYAETGAPLGSDPLCAYEPPGAPPGLEDETAGPAILHAEGRAAAGMLVGPSKK